MFSTVFRVFIIIIKVNKVFLLKLYMIIYVKCKVPSENAVKVIMCHSISLIIDYKYYPELQN